MTGYQRAVAFAELWNGELRGLVIQGKKVLVVRIDDAVYAYEDRCAHQGVMLSKGSLVGTVLSCSAHGWQYDVCTGCGVNPERAELKRLPVKVEGGSVFVDVEGMLP